MKLLVIVNCYPPDERISARRWGRLIGELQKLDFECSVLTAGDGNFSDELGEAGERVIRMPISNRPYAEAGRVGSTRNAIRTIAVPFAKYFIPQYFLKKRFRGWRLAAERSTAVLKAASDCDAVIASYGPIGTLLLGKHLSYKYKKPYCIDIRDSFQSKEGKKFIVSKHLSRRLEKKLLTSSWCRFAIGNKLANFLSSRYGLAFHAIYNGWCDSDVDFCRKEVRRGASSDQSPYLYYAGTIYPHRLRALTWVIKSIKSSDLRLRLRVLNYNSNPGIERVVKELGAENRVDLLPPIPSAELANEMAGSRGLLVLEEVSPSDIHDGNVTGKLFGLLASGLPGIAVCSPSSEIQSVVGQVDNWWAVSTEAACRCAINSLPDRPWKATGTKHIGAYHVEAQAERLANLIEEVVDLSTTKYNK